MAPPKDDKAPAADPARSASSASSAVSAQLERLVAVLCEDAIFAIASGPFGEETLESVAKRRQEIYEAVARGETVARMAEHPDEWMVDLCRIMAPIAPPPFIPMMDVVAEGTTLELGARGFRSLFSSKPSDKDIQRVKKLGGLSTQVLKLIFASDGPLDTEEQRLVRTFIAALGLPEADSNALFGEPIAPVDSLEIIPGIELGAAKAIVRGAWFAALSDGIDPREEQVLRVLAYKLTVPVEAVEGLRSDCNKRIENQKQAALACIDAVRFVLQDRVPGIGVQLPAHIGTLLLPRRFREEGLLPIAHGAPVSLARRFTSLPANEKKCALGIAWAAALVENPSLSRRAILRGRWEDVAKDLAIDAPDTRLVVEHWVDDQLTAHARAPRAV